MRMGGEDAKSERKEGYWKGENDEHFEERDDDRWVRKRKEDREHILIRQQLRNKRMELVQ